MEVIRAKRAGACYGVQRALDMADEVIADATGYAETEDEEILKARALFAERGVHRPEQQPIPAPIHPKGDAPVERRLVCGQRIVLLFGIESLPILGTEAHKPVQRTRRGPAHFSPGLHLRPVLAVKTQGLRFAA